MRANSNLFIPGEIWPFSEKCLPTLEVSDKYSVISSLNLNSISCFYELDTLPDVSYIYHGCLSLCVIDTIVKFQAIMGISLLLSPYTPSILTQTTTVHHHYGNSHLPGHLLSILPQPIYSPHSSTDTG